MVLGDMDFAPVNTCQSGQVEPPVLMACFAPPVAAAVTQYRGRLEVCLLPADDVHQARIT